MTLPAAIEFGYERATFDFAIAQASTEVIAAPGAGFRLRIHSVHVSGEGTLAFGTGGQQVISNSGAVPFVLSHPVVVGLTGDDNDNLEVTSAGAVSGEIVYHTIPV